MPRGLNKVILIGNLGDEPVIRKTNTGSSVANFSMVTNEVRRNTQTGESTEYAEWHRIVLWNKLAETAEHYMHKGSRIYLEGKIRNRSYLDKNNQKKYVTEIQGDELLLLDARPEGSSGSAPGAYGNAAPAPMPFSSQPQAYGSTSFQGESFEPQMSEHNRYGQAGTAEPQPAPQGTSNRGAEQGGAPLTEPAVIPDDEIPF